MKLDRRTVLAVTAAAFAAPLLSAYPARADAKRQALVDSSLESARKILTGKDYPDAAKYIQGARGVLIVPELVQGGLIFGLAGGRGARNHGSAVELHSLCSLVLWPTPGKRHLATTTPIIAHFMTNFRHLQHLPQKGLKFVPGGPS